MTNCSSVFRRVVLSLLVEQLQTFAPKILFFSSCSKDHTHSSHCWHCYTCVCNCNAAHFTRQGTLQARIWSSSVPVCHSAAVVHALVMDISHLLPPPVFLHGMLMDFLFRHLRPLVSGSSFSPAVRMNLTRPWAGEPCPAIKVTPFFLYARHNAAFSVV